MIGRLLITSATLRDELRALLQLHFIQERTIISRALSALNLSNRKHIGSGFGNEAIVEIELNA